MAFAAVFRLWGTFDLNEKIEDEILHVSYAVSLGTYGPTGDWSWQHPQLSGLLMWSAYSLFGDNPVGWRIGNVFFGTATVALVFLIGRILYPGRAVALIAAALLAFDPHHIYLSRTSFVEIPVTFFFLLYMYMLLEYTENKRETLVPAGIAMGLTMGTKAYFAFVLPLIALYALYRVYRRQELTREVRADFFFCLVLLPMAVYFLTYMRWFDRGSTLYEFVQMKFDAVRALKDLTMDNFAHNRDYLLAGGRPWEWFTKPLFWGHQRLLTENSGIFLIQSNNPPFRLLVIPSLFVASVCAWSERSLREFLAPLLFAGCYLLVLFAQRPIFSYSAAVMLPFAYYVLARTVVWAGARMRCEKAVYSCFLAAVIAWGAYMFPIAAARHVPVDLYRPVLSVLRYLGNF